MILKKYVLRLFWWNICLLHTCADDDKAAADDVDGNEDGGCHYVVFFQNGLI
jgi:hypothetical protein